VDIIPSVTDVRTWDRPRRMADTERGEQIRCDIHLLERLVEAYQRNDLRPEGGASLRRTVDR
jgi:fructose-1,6-bisphosphatase-3